MKFSIVIPVYNVEKYIDKCLNSILNQTYSNFEVIIVNDGSPDNSQNIIDKYVKSDNRFKSYIKSNGGLSDARNYGVKYCSGDYLLFVDSDDYVENNCLDKINEALIANNDIDVIKIKINIVDDSGNLIRKEKGLDKEGYTDFNELAKIEFLEPAWSYIYNLSFWNRNNFKYMKGVVHEDFGLTPEILMRAKKVYYLNFYGYNYVQRAGSIMTSNTSDKMYKKAYDMLKQYDRLIDLNYEKDTRIYKSFLSNAIIAKAKMLSKKQKKEFKKELIKRNVVDQLIDDTIFRKLKKLIMRFYIKI